MTHLPGAMKRQLRDRALQAVKGKWLQATTDSVLTTGRRGSDCRETHPIKKHQELEGADLFSGDFAGATGSNHTEKEY